MIFESLNDHDFVVMVRSGAGGVDDDIGGDGSSVGAVKIGIWHSRS